MDDDEAAFFSRPKRKVAAAPIHTSKRKKPVETSASALDNLIDSDDASSTDSDATLAEEVPIRKKQSAQTKFLPKKANNIKNDKVVMLDSASESDTASRRPKKSTNGRQTQRERSRSDSLTPPPQLSPRGLRQGSLIIRNAFDKRKNNRSELESPTTIVPDEAELLFEEQMRERAAREASPATRSISLHGERAPSRTNSMPIVAAPTDILEIIIRGVYVDLPGSGVIITDIKAWETPRILKIRLNMKLSIAKIGFCREAGISTMQDGVKVVTQQDQQRINEVVLVHNNIRIFDYSTPHDLGITKEDQPFFEAHTKDGWKYLESRPELRAAATARKHESAQVDGPADGDAEGDGQTMKLTLRAQSGAELKIRVRPSTKIQSILAAFKDKNAVPETSTVTLRFEGDMLAGTIANSDLEDGDVVDVSIQ